VKNQLHNRSYDVKIEFVARCTTTVLKESTPLKVGEIIDSSVMHLKALKFLKQQYEVKKTSCFQYT
jgi:isocitrate dehydrogenase